MLAEDPVWFTEAVALLILPANTNAIRTLTSHECFAGVEHKSTDSNGINQCLFVTSTFVLH